MKITYRVLLTIMDIHGHSNEPERHNTMRHRPANVIGVLVHDDVAGNQVEHLKDEEKDGRGQRALEQPGHSERGQDADGAVNQGVQSYGP